MRILNHYFKELMQKFNKISKDFCLERKKYKKLLSRIISSEMDDAWINFVRMMIYKLINKILINNHNILLLRL